jgi:hypothetical protein
MNQLNMFSAFQSAEPPPTPDAFDVAILVYRESLAAYTAAMLAADSAAAAEAQAAAKAAVMSCVTGKFSYYNVLAGFEMDTDAVSGEIPPWGHTGAFVLPYASNLRLHVKMHGFVNLGVGPFRGFEVRAVDASRPFISSSGYRSFIGAGYPGLFVPDTSVEMYLRAVLAKFIATDLKGKLPRIEQKESR